MARVRPQFLGWLKWISCSLMTVMRAVVTSSVTHMEKSPNRENKYIHTTHPFLIEGNRNCQDSESWRRIISETQMLYTERSNGQMDIDKDRKKDLFVWSLMGQRLKRTVLVVEMLEHEPRTRWIRVSRWVYPKSSVTWEWSFGFWIDLVRLKKKLFIISLKFVMYIK